MARLACTKSSVNADIPARSLELLSLTRLRWAAEKDRGPLPFKKEALSLSANMGSVP